MSTAPATRPRGRIVPATEAAKNFGRLVDAVRESRTEFIVERGGVAVARIAPVLERTCTGRDLVNLLRSAPSLGEGFRREVTAGRKRLNRRAVPKNPWAS
jgi:antitoxin (DNA-binding transcriptional repressor) of toxin-antitoxin stability system